MNFDSAFDLLMTFEGGYSNHAADPGGATLYGITEAVARENGYKGPMAELPLSVAKGIYKNQYWDAVKAEELPDSLRYVVFDAAVNAGVLQAAKWLQRALGVSVDGKIGSQTLKAAHEQNGIRAKFIGNRLQDMTSFRGWPVFSKGWVRRIASLLQGEQ